MRCVKASAVNDKDEELYPTKWNYEFADIPFIEDQHTPRSLNEWLNVHEYLVRLLQKFKGNLEVLTQFAAEIVQPFQGAGLEEFARRFRGATSAIPYVRHVFSGAGVSNPEAEAIASIKLANLDSGFLGQAYSEDSIVVEYDAHHFELLDPQLLKKYTDPILQRVQAAATKRRSEAHS